MNDFKSELGINFTNKTIEQYRDHLTDMMRQSTEKFISEITKCKEEILIAFLAKYDAEPDDVIACQMTDQNGGMKFWVEKKIPNEIDYCLHEETYTLACGSDRCIQCGKLLNV